MEEQNQEQKPTFGIRVREETPTKIVLEWREGYSVKRSITVKNVLTLLLIIVALSLIDAFGYIYPPLSWLLPWMISLTVLVTIASFASFRNIQEEEFDKNNPAIAETTTIDFDTQRAFRIKNSQSGKAEHIELDLRQVSQVRIQVEELGHHLRLYLESPNHEPFQVSIAFTVGSYSPDVLIAHGRKIGKILNKPVVRQHTDSGTLISEETIQP